MSIATSESGAGAGIQTDLKAFLRCGAYGTTAIVITTARNTVGVSAGESTLSVENGHVLMGRSVGFGRASPGTRVTSQSGYGRGRLPATDAVDGRTQVS